MAATCIFRFNRKWTTYCENYMVSWKISAGIGGWFSEFMDKDQGAFDTILRDEEKKI